MEVKRGMIHVDCTSNSSHKCSMGVAVRGLCMLVHFNDVLMLQIIRHYPGAMRHSIVILAAKLSPKCCLLNGTKVSRKMYRYAMPLTFLSRSTRDDLAPQWNASQTWTEPPPAWTLAVWQSCWKCSPSSRRTLMQPSTGYSWKRYSSQMTWDQAATVTFCHLQAQSRLSWWWSAVNRGFLRILRVW